jgi:hypothetical protein
LKFELLKFELTTEYPKVTLPPESPHDLHPDTRRTRCCRFSRARKNGIPVVCFRENSYGVSNQHLSLLDSKQIPFKTLEASSFPLPRSSQPRDEEYEIYLPLKYNDGTEIEPETLKQIRQRLFPVFGSGYGQFSFRTLSRYVRYGGVQFVDDYNLFFKNFKEQLKRTLRQFDILITVHNIETI